MTALNAERRTSASWHTRITWIVLLELFPLSVAIPAAPVLRCQLDYGGETQILDFMPSADPYRVKSKDIGRRFRFKAVVIGDEHHIDYIKLYTYYRAKRQPVLLHETKYLPPFVQSPSSYGFTGLNCSLNSVRSALSRTSKRNTSP